ncbi:hypothetical protein Tco_0705839 [Tanacetum coccineum]|uniref:Uncharacterized protein n=1 Tax=Tanacetum coccineum TaxID=301880 RepID=A0ABQ4Y790_9ASTR
MYLRFISVFLEKQLKNVPVPLDHFPINALTRKVFSFMVKKGKNFPGNITPLFESMLVPPTEDEEGSGGNHGGQSSSDRSLLGNEDGLTLQSVYDLCVFLCKQSVSMKQKLAGKKLLKTKWMQKEPVSKQGRKPAKAKPTVHKDPAFDDLDDIVDDAIDYMESEDAQDEGRTSSIVLEEKENTQKGVSTKVEVSTVKSAEGIDKPSEGTDRAKLSTDRPDEGTAEKKEQHLRESASPTAPTVTSTPTPTTPTPIVFGDDETIAQVLIIMSQNKEKLKEKEKGVELKDVEEIERPRPTLTRSLLTLRPLPNIDPKAKGKGRIEEEDESDTESEDITETEKKFKQLANDEEARLNADKILAEKLQEEERERDLSEINLLQEISLGTKLMDVLKHVGGKKHSGSTRPRILKKNNEQGDNEQVADASKKRVKKDDSVKREIKEEEGTRKRMLGTRKKMKSKKRKFTSKDDEELRLCLTITPDEDKEVDYKILDKKYPIIEWRSEYLITKPQYDETEVLEDVYLNVVIRSNRQRRYFSTLMAVLSILDRDDICAIYQLVMNRYQDETPEGFDKIIWGDLMIMFNQSDNDEFWNTQQNWKIVSWKLYSSSGVHTIMSDEGLVIHMLVENKYPLKKKVLSKLLELKLETEEDSIMALELIRFVKKQIAELEPKDSDGDEDDP